MSQKGERLLGLELSGVKNDRSLVVALDFYPKDKRLILAHLESPESVSSSLEGQIELSLESQKNLDRRLLSLIKNFSEKSQTLGLAIHAPLDFPPFFKNLHSPEQTWLENSSDPEIKWMREAHEKLDHKIRPFCPYLQRPVEIWLRHFTREKFPLSDALGSGLAPLAARVAFLKNFLTLPLYEVHPRVTLSRLISNLGISKFVDRNFSNLEYGVEARQNFYQQLLKKFPQIFIYEHDLEQLILKLPYSYAFLTAFTLFLLQRNQCEKRPNGFPQGASWIEHPKRKMSLEEIF